jgi:DNA polymerase-3 subunit epsilon
MAAWYDGRLASFDLETTSVDVEEARIVTAAIRIVEPNGGPLQIDADAMDWLLDPGVEIPDGAAEVHGITTERARAEGIPAEQGVHEVALTLGEEVKRGTPIVIYNARYDLTVLDREIARHELHVAYGLEGAKIIDPLVIDKWADQFRRGSRKLSAVCEHYGVELDGAHDAGADAMAALRLAWRMLHRADLVQGRYPEIVTKRALWKRVREDIDSLQGHQAIWAREQAIGLREYFERQGKTEEAASVREDWPLIPRATVPAERTGLLDPSR